MEGQGVSLQLGARLQLNNVGIYKDLSKKKNISLHALVSEYNWDVLNLA